jgi:hypothetical protein
MIFKGHLDALQALVAELGAVHFPLFLRLGSTALVRMQPVSARALLAEVDHFVRELEAEKVPGLTFLDNRGEVLGAMFGGAGIEYLAETDAAFLGVTPEGIRMVVHVFPPPAGFRSRPGLKPMHYECFFEQITCEGGAWFGRRASFMAGGDAPVALPEVPLPPVTRWDTARVAGRPAVAAVTFAERSAVEVFRDVIHAFRSACDESLRLKSTFEFRRT